MVLSFVKTVKKNKNPKINSNSSDLDSTPFEAESEVEKPTPPTQKANPVNKSTGVTGWMKKGQAARAALAEEEAHAEKAKAERDKLWRFWMPEGEDRKVSFLDGDLDNEGMLDIPMFHEHFVKVNGKFEHYVCTMEQEGFCPICNKGESKPALVGLMTVIDHTPYTVKSGQNAGKTYKNRKKLFVAKKQTVRILSKLAVKRGGLTGVTFDISRSGEMSAGVGNQFDFDEKQSLQDVASKYALDPVTVKPADYEYEITYRSAKELAELGLGSGPSGPGYEASNSIDMKNLEDEL